MGDRTYQYLTIYECPPDKVNAVLDIINEHGYSDLYSACGGAGAETATDLNLGAVYNIEEAYLGTANDAATALAVLETVAFETAEDEKYEYAGDVYRFFPDLGMHNMACGDGPNSEYVHAYTLRTILAEHPDDPAAVVAEIRPLLGTEWTERIENIEKRLAEMSTEEKTLRPWPECRWCSVPLRTDDTAPTAADGSIVCLPRVEAAGGVTDNTIHELPEEEDD